MSANVYRSSDRNWQRRAVSFVESGVFDPFLGHWGSDFFWASLVLLIQVTILPGFFGTFLSWDILTPWIAVLAATAHPVRVLIVTSIAALFLEGRGTTPAGFFFCTYGSLALATLALRAPFSWAHRTPWLVLLVSAQLWVLLFRLIVFVIVRPQTDWEWNVFISAFLGSGIAILFGLRIAEFVRVRNLGDT